MATKYPVKVHEWQPAILSRYSFEVLEELIALVIEEHRNDTDYQGVYFEKGVPTIHMIDARGRRKLDKLSWAIYHKQCRASRV